MNVLIDRGILQELTIKNSFSYVLSQKEYFLPVEYKVLHSKSNDGFVQCVKAMLNGHIQLFYITEHLRPMISAVSSMEPNNFLTLVSNLLTTVSHVKSNGFLSCQNIDISFDRVYVDPATLKVSLVYVPLSCHIHYDYAAFENELRTGLVRLINSLPQLSSPRITRLCIALANGMMSLENVIEEIDQSKSEDTIVSGSRKRWGDFIVNKGGKKRGKLVATNGRPGFEVNISKDEFILGKNPYAVDAVLDYNPAISRIHCKVTQKNGSWILTDLGSANGTYINGSRLGAQSSGPVQDGDIIRLATSEFRFVVK